MCCSVDYQGYNPAGSHHIYHEEEEEEPVVGEINTSLIGELQGKMLKSSPEHGNTYEDIIDSYVGKNIFREIH